MGQDAPEVAWDEVELLLVGTVVGDWRVVLVVEELAAVDEPEAVEAVPEAALLVPLVCEALLVLVCEALLVPPEVADVVVAR
jgi:hypothetical protein